MKFLFGAFLFLFSLLVSVARVASAQPTPARTLIIYNSSYIGDQDKDGIQDSLEVAQYYAAKREIPSQNLLGVPFADAYAISGNFAALQSAILQPLKDKLAALGASNIDLIVMSYMTPYSYAPRSLDTIIAIPYFWNSSSIQVGGSYLFNYAIRTPYLDMTPGFGVGKGRFTHADTMYRNNNMYLVGRLDGPGGVWRVLDLVDQALYGERFISQQPGGFMGNAYIDTQALGSDYTDASLSTNTYVMSGEYSGPSNNPYVAADFNIAWGKHFISAKGLPLKWDNNYNEIGSNPSTFYQDGTSSFTAPRALVYGGWHADNKYYPNAWEWLPGSIGIDLDSVNFSYGLRNDAWPAWGPRALQDGLSATCGVLDEPYVFGHPRSTNVIKYILDGYTFAEASMLGTPFLGYLSVCIGDPLYAPFKTKTAVNDTAPPQIESGFPRISWSANEGHVFEVFLKDVGEPDVANLKIEYGKTSALGLSVTYSQFYKRWRGLFAPLESSTTYYARAVLTDPAGNVTTSSTINFNTTAQTPYGGTPQAIPGTIPFYAFDEGGEGVAYHDTMPDNYHEGQRRNDTGVEVFHVPPYQVFSVDAEEWLEYTVNIAQAGKYTVNINIIDSFAGKLHLEIDGVNVSGVITKSSFGGPGTVSKSEIVLPAGQHIMRVAFDEKAADSLGSFGSMEFIRNGTADSVAPNPPKNVKIEE